MVRGRARRVVLAALVWSGAALAGEVYKWTDPDGRVHFGDRPPAGVATEELRIRTLEGPAEVDTVSGSFAHQSVVLYSTDWCGVCKRAKAHLKQRGVIFTEFDIEKNGLALAEYRRLGGKGVPLILVGDQRMNGFSAARLDRLLRNAGWALRD